MMRCQLHAALPSTRLQLAAPPALRCSRGAKRQRLQPLHVGWVRQICRSAWLRDPAGADAWARAQDPEGILATPRGGHISRQQTRKNMQENLELQKQYDAAKEEAAEDLRQRREVCPRAACPSRCQAPGRRLEHDLHSHIQIRGALGPCAAPGRQPGGCLKRMACRPGRCLPAMQRRSSSC